MTDAPYCYTADNVFHVYNHPDKEFLTIAAISPRDGQWYSVDVTHEGFRGYNYGTISQWLRKRGVTIDDGYGHPKLELALLHAWGVETGLGRPIHNVTEETFSAYKTYN